MKILIVEDDVMIGMILEDMLSDLGHEAVGPAMCVQSALEEVDNCDAAILDLNLGKGITSLPVADALRERGIPFFFSSGYTEGDLEQYLPVAHLQKPYNQNDLLVAISKIA